MTTLFSVSMELIALLVAVGIAAIARKFLRLSMTWAAVIAVAVFVALNLPIKTHVVKLDMPKSSQ